MDNNEVELYSFKRGDMTYTMARGLISEAVYLKEELRRCKESPWYFYTNYLTIDGKKGKTMMTEDEFNSAIKGE